MATTILRNEAKKKLNCCRYQVMLFKPELLNWVQIFWKRLSHIWRLVPCQSPFSWTRLRILRIAVNLLHRSGNQLSMMVS